MGQIEMPLLQRLQGPAVVPTSMLALASTYRQAVRVCWQLRRAKGLTVTDLAREFGFNRQHASDYLNPDDAPTRRNLPPEQIATFEDVCGNAFITQWLAARQGLTVLEELQAERAAA